MRNKNVIFLLAAYMLSVSTWSCVQCKIRKAGNNAARIYKYHMLDINADGEHKNRIKSLTGITAEQHYSLIMDSLRAYLSNTAIPNKKVLLFFHGGMNSPKVSYKRSFQKTDMILQDSIYPIFINWHSGPLSSYGQHATQVSQGVRYRWVRAFPVSVGIFAGDVLIGVAKTPSTMYTTASSFFMNIGNYGPNGKNWNRTRRNSMALYEVLNKKMNGNDTNQIDIHWGNDDRRPLKSTIIGLHSTLFIPFRSTNFFWDGLGTPSWTNMKRRAHSLFHPPSEFDIRAIAQNESLIDEHLEVSRRGVVPAFMDSMSNLLKDKHDQVEIIAMGHSMGAIILNDLLIEYPEFEIDKIVEMGAASSIDEVRLSVIPYLSQHKNTTFYNLSLHPAAENREHMVGGTELLIARGSLLNHIDNMFEHPATFMDRTSGKWENIIQATHLIPDSVRGRVTLKCFDIKNYKKGKKTYRKDPEKFHPQKHGQFDDATFWKEAFWRIPAKPILSS